MDPILREFLDDLIKIKNVLQLLKTIKQFGGQDVNNEYLSQFPNEEWINNAKQVHNDVRACHIDISILPGVLVLYLAGRFENYIRALVEELSQEVAARCNQFDRLPKVMKENIIKLTAEVISNPRKYGHGDNGVASFIRNLNANINDNNINSINSECLSITFENMRPDLITSIFERVGAKNIWESIGQQNGIKIFFETNEAGQSQNEAKKFLNSFMDLRDRIAHPSGELTWPDLNIVLRHIEFFSELATAIFGFANVYLVQVTNANRTPQNHTA